MTRVVWTNLEKQLVTEQMIKILRVEPGRTNQQVLQEAQLVLPRDRRIVVSHGRVYSHKPKIEKARVDAKALGAPVALPAATEVPPPAPERKETPTERLAGILDLLVDALADRVAAKLAERLALQVQVETTTTSAPFRPRHNPEPTGTAPKTCRPGVLILGLLSQTGEQMRREFGDRLDIQWYDTDDATKRTVHPMANVVLMTKFVNRSVQERWRKSGVLHYCNGGVSQLREILANL